LSDNQNQNQNQNPDLNRNPDLKRDLNQYRKPIQNPDIPR